MTRFKSFLISPAGTQITRLYPNAVQCHALACAQAKRLPAPVEVITVERSPDGFTALLHTLISPDPRFVDAR